MKKAYKLENLGCAACAAKMESKIKKLKGVNSASLSYMMQKLSVDLEEDAEGEII